jgi:hypothetical protein
MPLDQPATGPDDRSSFADPSAFGEASVPPLLSRAEINDIAKSAGIGLANGALRIIGGPANAKDMVDQYIIDPILHACLGPPPMPNGNPPPTIEQFLNSASLQKGIETVAGHEFYEPRSRVGRYAESIGELAPALLGSLGGAVPGATREAITAAELAPSWLSRFGRNTMTDVVAPGVVAEAIDEAMPDTKFGYAIRHYYTPVRRSLPFAIATARRFLDH